MYSKDEEVGSRSVPSVRPVPEGPLCRHHHETPEQETEAALSGTFS